MLRQILTFFIEIFVEAGGQRARPPLQKKLAGFYSLISGIKTYFRLFTEQAKITFILRIKAVSMKKRRAEKHYSFSAVRHTNCLCEK